ncbi:YceI-like domain-containing protein [Mucilaginibacter yixingensis]|uniref:YceI-like domain-containing protein n=1 Tax=Mucilaginibacter yixingensis TaxID=1295612 RepID=A0A2T5J903_9SPHI|nr:YceI family protein [Mucilaginibacter yixingensis]PTQ96551.1 YceI-like domain-containing protein [Mucilaginibacter yixingensis]
MTKKFFFLFLILVFSYSAKSQVLITTEGKVSFFSETPVENISALNTNVSSLVNTATDSVLVRIKNTGFTFKNALMREHFNENYMESTKYPFDTFRGKIDQPIDWKKDGTYKVSATGKIMIHGVEKPITISGLFTIKAGTVHLESEFFVHTEDFKIEIPKLVFEKIAENIKVTLLADFSMVKK